RSATLRYSAGSDDAEEPVCLPARPGEEVERRRRSSRGPVSECDRPETVDRDRRAVAASELGGVPPLSVAAVVVRADPAVPEVPDQQVAGERSETRRSERQPPRSIRGCVLAAA